MTVIAQDDHLTAGAWAACDSIWFQLEAAHWRCATGGATHMIDSCERSELRRACMTSQRPPARSLRSPGETGPRVSTFAQHQKKTLMLFKAKQ